MSSSTTAPTTGYLRATLGGTPWTAASVVFISSGPSFQVGGPEGGIIHEGVFFTFPSTIQPGEYQMNAATQCGGWYNPGQNASSWLPNTTDVNNKVTVRSVSVATSEIEISFDFEVIERSAPNRRLKIVGDAKFGGASASTAVYKQP